MYRAIAPVTVILDSPVSIILVFRVLEKNEFTRMLIGKPESAGPISAFHNSNRAFSYDVTAAILVYQKQ